MCSHPLRDLVDGFEGFGDLGHQHPAVDLVRVHSELGLDAGGARPAAPRPALTNTDAILTELGMESQIPALRAAGASA